MVTPALAPVAAFRHAASGLIMTFERNAYGGVSGTSQKTVNGGFGLQWVDYGGLIPHFPSACVDGNGRTVLATTGIDGRLYFRRQQSSTPHQRVRCVDSCWTVMTSRR